ncbi:MAG: histidine phosphatase family protein [Novosphingobium sp. 17-62-19]|uniref:histidine phosphatase family protein n=1 Tax=Novosphingobium sp. 17-62-19 TaxID=1970406 RepID=UPI000BC8D1A8|nr:histidine phosphatase family protein [Novosphingobium sp. 17-62-19]OZA21523.1 MAG: histidine phosphatase family protein [Novosphingobium sp. 17-62-19]HQS95124.1 histidine phosphatase family protein [Novosphingobium sp.]
MLVIVRHGNTFNAGEPPRRIGARTDLPLTPEGMAQADALGRHFAHRGWHFARTLTSPLLRTRQTVAAILAAQATPTSLESAEFLREIDHGPDENLTEPEVVARIGQPALTAWDEHAIVPPGWTVDADRRIGAWQALLDALALDQSPILLVTSNGAARFALKALPTLPPVPLKLATGSYGVIRRNYDGTLAVPIWGQRP